MQIVRDLAGYTYGRSDLLRRAMSKKKMDVMLAEKEIFIEGCGKNGIPAGAAENIFNQMVSFAEYAFNKSHAAAYAVVGYQTGYLKVHYPVEFMAALMSSVMGDAHQISNYIRNCGEMGIEVLPPDVNASEKKFVAGDGKIRFGLLGVKNVGEGAIEAIIEARETKGEPKDLHTFINNLDIRQVNKKAVESLIKAGALDSLEGNRAQHLAVYEKLIESAQSGLKKNIEGQISLFQSHAEEMDNPSCTICLPQITEFPKETLISMEKEMLGVYLTDHPLNAYKERIENLVTATSALLADEEQQEIKDGDKVVVAGIISGKRNLITKNNKQMAFVQIEDFYGETEVIVFPNVFERYGQILEEDAIISVRGTVNFKEDEAPKVLADVITDVKKILPDEEPIKVKIPDEFPEGETLEKIRELLMANRGKNPVIIYLHGGKAVKTTEELWTEKSDDLLSGLQELLGAENVKV